MSIPITLAGSWPKSRELRRARYRLHEEEIDAAEFLAEEDVAIEAAIRFQESLGISVLTDGELGRSDLVAHYAGKLGGLEPGFLVRCWGNRYVRRPRVTASICRQDPFLVEPWKRVQARTSSAVRAQITGPYTLMHWSFDEYYGEREACARALAVAIGDEVEALSQAGATEIQIDEPAFCASPDERGWAVELINSIVTRATSSRVWVRAGFVDPTPDWGALAALGADRLVLDLAHQGLMGSDGLRRLSQTVIVVAGVIDALEPEVETIRQICARIELLLERVPREKLVLTTDGAMRVLELGDAEAKLKNLAQAAASF